MNWEAYISIHFEFWSAKLGYKSRLKCSNADLEAQKPFKGQQIVKPMIASFNFNCSSGATLDNGNEKSIIERIGKWYVAKGEIR